MALESNPRAAFKMSTEQERLMPPSGKPLIIHVVVNIEYGVGRLFDVSLTHGNIARIFATRTWPAETGLAGWGGTSHVF